MWTPRASQRVKEMLPIRHQFESWAGLGLIARGIEREGYRLHFIERGAGQPAREVLVTR